MKNDNDLMVIRRVDDLGRIVIPKEIRKKMKLEEGDPLEMIFDEDLGILSMKKYGQEQLKTTLYKLITKSIDTNNMSKDDLAVLITSCIANICQGINVDLKMELEFLED